MSVCRTHVGMVRSVWIIWECTSACVCPGSQVDSVRSMLMIVLASRVTVLTQSVVTKSMLILASVQLGIQVSDVFFFLNIISRIQTCEVII